MKHDVLEAAYARYYEELYLYAFSLCKDIHLAEELVSDTFYKAFITLEDEVVKYWLLRVCKNLFIDKYRRDKRLVAPQGDVIDTNAEGVLDSMIRKERYAQLYRCMLRLPVEQRSAVYMQYFMGMDVRSIAHVLSKQPGAVKTMLSRARMRLRSMMEDGNGF